MLHLLIELGNIVRGVFVGFLMTWAIGLHPRAFAADRPESHLSVEDALRVYLDEDLDQPTRMEVSKIVDSLSKDQILSYLEHPDVRVRAGAIYAVGWFSGARDVEMFAALLKDQHSEVRAAAVAGLGRRPAGAKYTQEITQSLHGATAFERRSAAWALSQLGQRQCVDQIAPLLSDPDVKVRIAAASALGTLEAKEYAAEAIKAMTSIVNNEAESVDVRMDADSALLDWDVDLKKHDMLWDKWVAQEKQRAMGKENP